MGREQGRAKRASRMVLELVMLLSDGSWHSTGHLGIAAGKYMRPEIAWRTGKGNINYGRRLYVNHRLNSWERIGRIEKRRNGKFTEWRLGKAEWVVPYLRVLVETLREQLDRHSSPPSGKSRVERVEREQEILRLSKEGFSQRQIAEKVGSFQSFVSYVLKASRARIGGDKILSPLPLLHRTAIADAPPEKQPEIARVVAEQRLTLEQTKRLVRQAREQ